ncbi:hypothetical protein FJTKL_03729 [Diaporthe vaccinii]|uniref:Secreted peptide n=1 Tax=Diaporthe vaccinii TaxID=105482 RepID=A0ABR4DUJ1_9PEZI
MQEESAPIGLFLLCCALSLLSLPPLSSPVRPSVDLDLLPITPGLILCLRPRLPYHTTPPVVAVQSFHWISILANLLFCTIASLHRIASQRNASPRLIASPFCIYLAI